MNTEKIVFTTCLLLSLSMLIQSFEMLATSKQINPSHPWHWQNLNSDFKEWPTFLQLALREIFQNHFTALVYLQIIALFCLPFIFHWSLLLILLITSLMINLRFRGVFNGGSDYMTMVVLSGLLATAFLQSEFHFLTFGLYYIAIQCTLSYFVAGIVKVKNSSWRNGYALQIFLTHSNYSVPSSLRKAAQYKWFNRLSSWGVIFWECTFPLAWFNQKLTIIYLAIGFLFHLSNFISFGLNRFVFAWLASYPAVLFCTQR